ncbi:MAG: hypothetical protein MRJ68_19705 [Nitrospira sp.]|nr:hypothetical protein [Nitrospira sp.]
MISRILLQLVITASLCGTVSTVWAYEASPGASSTDPCNQVIFSAFTPPPFSVDKNNVEVAPKSEFSLLISKAALPSSITAKIKDEQIPVTVKPINNGLVVKGKLPESAVGRYIRLDIFAKGPGGCDKADGWLLKVGK